MESVLADDATQLSNQVDAARFVRDFFDAIARRDWPAVAVSVHNTASLFIVDPTADGFAMLPWERAAPAFREWMERSVNAKRFAFAPDAMAVQVQGQSALVTLPLRAGVRPRVMVLVLEDGRWQVRHLNLERLGIPLTASDIDFSFEGIPQPRPIRLASYRR